MSRPTKAGDRARYLLDSGPGSAIIDRTLAFLDVSHLADDYDLGGGRVLIRRLELGVVAHVPLWRAEMGWWLPACGADANRHSWAGGDPYDRWEIVEGPLVAAVARHCRRCRWG